MRKSVNIVAVKKSNIVAIVPTKLELSEDEKRIEAWKEGYNIAIVNVMDLIKSEKLDAQSSKLPENIAYNRAIQDVLFSVKKLKQ